MSDSSQPTELSEQGSKPAGARLWGRWVAANALGELLGLGLIGLVAGVVASRYSSSIPGWVVLPGVLLLGTLEGVLVGACQWLAVRQALPRLQASTWIRATAGGALLAWILGMLPSTLMDMASSSSTAPQAAPVEPSEGVQMLLAAALGVVAGPILAGVQWRVLRRHVSRAGWWIPANSLAWALGMPLVFIAVGTAAESGALTLRGALLGLGLITVAGGVVGMVHGLVLLRLLKLAAPWKAARTAGALRPRWRSLEFKRRQILAWAPNPWGSMVSTQPTTIPPEEDSSAATGAVMPPNDERDYYERIYKVVNQIPRGMVATYGDVAAIVGDGCDGRIVGHALGALGPRSVQVAWQRVIGRNGRVTTSGLHQPDKLAAEGVQFDERGYVLMERFHWAGPSAEWAQAQGFQQLPKGGAAEDAPDNQLSLF